MNEYLSKPLQALTLVTVLWTGPLIPSALAQNDSSTGVAVAEPFEAPADVNDVSRRVGRISRVSETVQIGIDNAKAAKLAYQDAIRNALMSEDVKSIAGKVEAGRKAWLKATRAASAGVGQDLKAVVAECRGLSEWAALQLPRIKSTLQRRMALAERTGDRIVRLNNEEVEALDAFDRLDGVEDEIIGNETNLSIERLTDILGRFDADVASLRLTTSKLNQAQRYYARISEALRAAETMIVEDEGLGRDGALFAGAVSEANRLLDSAFSGLMDIRDVLIAR
ncbi:MAG: hypothetical protein AB7O66_13655 [Limisphaerales bacterium]